MADPIERMKVLITCSTPVVVIGTVEEMRAVGMLRAACAELNLAVLEWSIADGLVRSGTNAPAIPAAGLQMRLNARRHSADANAPESSQPASSNRRVPVQVVANRECMT